MPLSFLVAFLLFGVLYILTNAGFEGLHAFALIMEGVLFILIISFSIVFLGAKDHSEFKKILRLEFKKSIEEIKSFFDIKSGGGK